MNQNSSDSRVLWKLSSGSINSFLICWRNLTKLAISLCCVKCSYWKECELETHDASDHDGNDELKESEESAENEEFLNSTMLPRADKKKSNLKQIEKELENQVPYKIP